MNLENVPAGVLDLVRNMFNTDLRRNSRENYKQTIQTTRDFCDLALTKYEKNMSREVFNKKKA